MADGEISRFGVLLIGTWEGNENVGYADGGGVPTIGIGHTGPEVNVGDTITDEQVLKYFRGDIGEAMGAINSEVTVTLLPNQFDALVSFIFNVGVDAFTDSTLLKKLNTGAFESVPGQLSRWVNDNGQVVTGLINRRNAEIDLWQDSSKGHIVLMERAMESGKPAEAAKQAMLIDQTPGILNLTVPSRTFALTNAVCHCSSRGPRCAI